MSHQTAILLILAAGLLAGCYCYTFSKWLNHRAAERDYAFRLEMVEKGNQRLKIIAESQRAHKHKENRQ